MSIWVKILSIFCVDIVSMGLGWKCAYNVTREKGFRFGLENPMLR